jgi:two-component system response regulator YesN
MYNVLLVEDEILERENSRESWIWNTGEFKLCGDAANGQDAWEKLQQMKIDILITDIKMPFMDGLSLTRLVRQNLPHIRIIILSGYSEFAYAQQALCLGVSEYIVKPVKSAELLESLRRIATQLETEQAKEDDIEKLRTQAVQSKAYQMHKFLEDLSLGIYPQSALKDRADNLGINIKARFYAGAILQYSEQKLIFNEDDHMISLDIQKSLDEIIGKNPNIFSFRHDLKEIYFLFKEDDDVSIKSNIEHLFFSLKEAITRQAIQCVPLLAAGGIRNNISGIAESFADAKMIMSLGYLFTNRDIILADETLFNDLAKSYGNEIFLYTEKNMIENLLKFGNKLDVEPLIRKLLLKMKELRLSFILCQFISMEIINSVRVFLNDLGDTTETVYIHELENCMKWANDLDKFGIYIIKIIQYVIEVRERKKNYKYVNIIAAALKYIDEHYTDANLNLNDVASYINISSSYFSTLFAQEMGESFIEYITRKRIDKAKELLTTSCMRLTDIAYEVGYQDSNYFSKIFKKITNDSPKNFRSAIVMDQQ